ncbi:MAG: protein kinase [Nitrospirae bacterium]|nr:protein kinase [Nitrospirota bacterium]
MPLFGSKEENELKKAAKLEQDGQWQLAAQAFMKLGRQDDAARLYAKSGDAKTAADIYLRNGNGEKAFSLLRTARNKEEGARLLQKHGQREFAARLFIEAGRYISAAEIYESTGQFLQAADLFSKGDMISEAAQCYEKAGDFPKATGMFLRIFQTELHRHQIEPGYPKERLVPLATKCASLKYQMGQFPEAAEILQRVGMLDKAAAIYAKIGHLDKAAKIYEDVGDFARAADIYERLGKKSDAQLIKARYYENKGEIDQAAKMYYAAGHYTEAGNLYWRMGQLMEAAQCAEKETNYSWAADLYREAGQTEKARQCDLKAGRIPPPAAGPAAAAIPQPKPKPVVSRYQKNEILGRGGMGVVYRALDKILNRTVALKVLADDLKKDPEAIEQLMREARAAAALNHPNVVTIYDAGRENEQYFIVMEYVEGTLLKSLIKRTGPLNVQECLPILRQLCQGLAYAHGRQIVHRDIKPGNVMITADKTVKIMDFGLAKKLGQSHTKSTVMGTPYYMSPEQVEGAETDHRSDIYSLGATLFEILAGRPPFTDGDVPYHHRHSPPPDPTLFATELPSEWSAVILRCLEKDPARRFDSALEILKGVESI